jgi:hypothetical protein
VSTISPNRTRRAPACSRLRSHRAWIAVYPLTAAATAGFKLFHREFDRAYLDNDWCIGADDGMIEIRTVHAESEAELTQRLADWNVSPGNLDYAHRSDHPV